MPIRIRPDQDQGSYTPRNRGGSGGGGGGGLGNLIPLLIGLFGRNPKMMLIVAVIGIIIYFAGGKGCGNILSPDSTEQEASSGIFSKGASFDLAKYSSTEIFEPLADNKKEPLPEKISLEKFAPNRLNQGQQGSCVAWASAYAARSIMRSRETGTDPNSNTFSPSFLYNQIALEGCQGSYLNEALKVMQQRGLAPYSAMPYTDEDCSARPDVMTMRKAEDFKIDGYNRLTGGRNGEDARSVNMLAIKQNLAQGAPVVIGMMVGGSFMQNMIGKENWIPSDADFGMQGFGGHAMCVIGYDDYKFGSKMGGFQIMNSWGTDWGKNGIAWVSYEDFEHFVKEAYGIYPMSEANTPSGNLLEASFGIIMNKDGQSLSLEQTGKNIFRTSNKIPTNADFKIEVINNIACYVYVFGSETDGSQYVLFPYTPKHSPYCGITGRRLFPRDFSLFADDQGSVDEFAIVISAKPIDYDDLKKKLNNLSAGKLSDKLNNISSPGGNFKISGNNQINVRCDIAVDPLTAVVIEVIK